MSTPYVLCKDIRTDEKTNVKVMQVSPTVLKCEGTLYNIDPSFKNIFKLNNCITVNPQKDGLYTMFYVSDSDHAPGAEVNETWHDAVSI
jgi:hypothetical protein